MSRPFVKALLIVVLAMLVPILPFALIGSQSEGLVDTYLLQRDAAGWAAIAVVALLAIDILLPVPSTAVLTWAGAAFGWPLATLLGWVGLTVSAYLGYWLGRRFGIGLVRKFSSEADLQRVTHWLNQRGRWLLAGLRIVPVMGEASVLVAGVYRMSTRQFHLPVLLANLVIATLFCGLGACAADSGGLLWAMLAACAIPVLLMFAIFRVKTVQ